MRGVIRPLPGQREGSRPKHDITEGVMTSADDARLEATLWIDVYGYALQCQTQPLMRADASCSMSA